MFYFTSSWDDGDVHDMRVAELLDRYGLRGTFYITRDQKNRLSDTDIKGLAAKHEVGAHTLTHPHLSKLTIEEKEKEIRGSKEWLDGVVGTPVQMFCYPYGDYDEETKQVVMRAGFAGARTTTKTLGTHPTDPYMLPVTMLTYRQPFGLTEKVSLTLGGNAKNSTWEKLAREKLTTVAAQEGYFHLWGHSWEIERLKLWDSLEVFLKEVSERTDVQAIPNSELLTHL